MIRIEGGKIVSVGPSQGAVTYDLSSATVMPGFIDTHVHVDWHFGPDGKFQPRGDTPAQHALHAAENAYPEVLGGDQAKQIEAVTQYLMTLGQAGAAAPAAPARATTAGQATSAGGQSR